VIGRRAACAGIATLLLSCTRKDEKPKAQPRDPKAPRAHRDDILRFAFVDATTLVSASADAACAWDVASGKQLWRVKLDEPYGPGVTRPGMIPDFDGTKRVVALERAGVAIHRADGGIERIGVSTALGNAVLIGFGPGSVVVMVSGAVVVRRIEDGATIFERSDLGVPHGQSRDRRLLAIQDVKKKKLTIVDVTSGAILGTADVWGERAIFSDDGKSFVVNEGADLRVFDVATGVERLRIPFARNTSDGRNLQAKPEDVKALAFGGGLVVSQHTPSEIATYDAVTGKVTLYPAHPKNKNDGVGFDVTPDTKYAVGMSQDELFWFDLRRSNLFSPRDITPPVPIAERPLVGEPVPLMRLATHLAIAPDGRFVAFGGRDGIFAVDARSMLSDAVRLD
jgi:hypothetical protein